MGEIKDIMALQPTDLFDILQKEVIGQDKVLKYVAVSLYKHIHNKPCGNLILIGNSGTGKTSMMKSIEQLYLESFDGAYQAVARINAHSLSNEENEIVTYDTIFKALENRAIQLLGKRTSEEEIKKLLEHSTVCIDEIDKITARISGKPNVTGVKIQQSLLTLMEGETIIYDTNIFKKDADKSVQIPIDTSKILFVCGGAFEELYDQVYSRVFQEKGSSGLTKLDMRSGIVEFKQIFTLREYLRQDDLFGYGMLPQFLSRFDSYLVLNELKPEDLKKIFTDINNSIFQQSKEFFQLRNIELSITEKAKELIANQAASNSRIGARALKDVYSRVIKPLEYDPFGSVHIKSHGDQHEITITENIVKEALGLK